MSRISHRAGQNLVGISAFAVLLAVGLSALAYVHPASAAKPDCNEDPPHPSCKPDEPDDGGSGGDDFLDATFDLTIGLTPSHGQWLNPVPDATAYSDSKKSKVIVSTLNSSDGFRFDTNSQNTNKTRNFGSGRVVELIMSDVGSQEVEIDFRFNWVNGLDLGALVAQDGSGDCPAVAPSVCSDVVAAVLTYYNGQPIDGFSAVQHGSLAFGALQHDADPAADQCLADSGLIRATRTSDTTWTLESESGKACRFGRNASRDTECLVDTVECDPDLIFFALRFDLVMQ